MWLSNNTTMCKSTQGRAASHRTFCTTSNAFLTGSGPSDNGRGIKRENDFVALNKETLVHHGNAMDKTAQQHGTSLTKLYMVPSSAPSFDTYLHVVATPFATSAHFHWTTSQDGLSSRIGHECSKRNDGLITSLSENTITCTRITHHLDKGWISNIVLFWLLLWTNQLHIWSPHSWLYHFHTLVYNYPNCQYCRNIDYILVYFRNPMEYAEHLKQILKRLRKRQLHAKTLACTLHIIEVQFLG